MKIIKVLSVKHEVYNDIGYLRITSFTEQTEEGLLKSINTIQKENEDINGYVLDLRSNPGGLLNHSLMITDIFLKRGEIVSTRGRETVSYTHLRAHETPEHRGCRHLL